MHGIRIRSSISRSFTLTLCVDIQSGGGGWGTLTALGVDFVCMIPHFLPMVLFAGLSDLSREMGVLRLLQLPSGRVQDASEEQAHLDVSHARDTRDTPTNKHTALGLLVDDGQQKQDDEREKLVAVCRWLLELSEPTV